jgi:hypothetical protein
MEATSYNWKKKFLFLALFFTLILMIWGWVLYGKREFPREIGNDFLLIISAMWSVAFVLVLIGCFFDQSNYTNNYMILFGLAVAAFIITALVYSSTIIQELSLFNDLDAWMKVLYAFVIASVIVGVILLLILLGILLYIAKQYMYLTADVDIPMISKSENETSGNKPDVKGKKAESKCTCEDSEPEDIPVCKPKRRSPKKKNVKVLELV